MLLLRQRAGEFNGRVQELAAQGIVAVGVNRRTEIDRLVGIEPDPKKILEFEALAQTFGYSLGVENLAERRIEVKHGASRPGRFDRGARHGRRGGGREKPMTVSLPGSVDIAIRPSHYKRLAEKIAGKPEERIVAYLMLRSLKQARYQPNNVGHFGLALPAYAHFTSPIRRYPDLLVHRAIRWLNEKRGPKGFRYALKEMEQLG